MKNEEMNKNEAYSRQWIRMEEAEAEAGNEFTLPDYLPPIRRILRAEASLAPAGAYVSGDRAEFAGSAALLLVYTDPEGGITAVPLSGDYEYAVKDKGQIQEAVAEETVESVYCRPQGPRRVLLRARIRSRATLLAEERARSLKKLLPEGVEEEAVEVLEGKGLALGILPVQSEECALSASLVAEGIPPQEMKLLFCRGEIRVQETQAREGEVLVKGEALLSCLAQSGEGTLPFSFQTAVPLEEVISAQGVRPGMSVLCRGITLSCEGTLSDNGQGGSIITFDAVYTLLAEALYNTPCRFVKDLYGKGMRLECKAEKKAISALVGGRNQSFPLSASVPCRSEEDGLPLAVLDVSGRILQREAACQDGCVILSGEWEAQMILSGHGEGLSLFPFTAKIPFRVELPIPEARFGDGCRYTLALLCPRAKIDGDRFVLSADLGVSAAVLRVTQGEEAVSASLLEEEMPEEGGRILLYYPTGEDSLWSVGKKYGASLATLARQNGLGDEVLADADIPHKISGLNYVYIEK